MTTETEHYGLTKLNPSEGVHAGDGKFPSADRDQIDDLLYAAIHHVHDGAVAGSATAPTLAPVLTPSTTGGTIPPDTTVRYVYTFTDPETGQTTASPEATYTTSSSVEAPAAPTFTLQSIGGTLEPGQYFYVLTAYQSSSTVETKALNPVSVEIPVGTSTNQVELTLPALPSGATGFNIYRRAPSETKYFHLDTDAGGSYTDDGSVSPTTRTIPSENSTNATTSIEVEPGSSVPAGNTWTIYRSYSTSYLDSYLVNLDDATTAYTDTGIGTQSASPPDTAFGSQTSNKIVLTDGSNVSGTLPLGLVPGFPTTIPFATVAITVKEGDGVYVVECPTFEILGIRAVVKIAPTGSAVVANVKYWDPNAATPTWTSLGGAGSSPSIGTGNMASTRAAPTTTTLTEGTLLRADITQADSGTTASGLTVSVYGLAVYSTTDSDDYEV